MKVYDRIYDNPFTSDGVLKQRKLLGDFNIIETISESMYSSSKIGTMNGKVYLISENEVTGFNGGSRFDVKELKSVFVK